MRLFQKFNLDFLRSVAGVLVAAGLFYVCTSAIAQGQPSKDKDTRFEVIDRAEGERRLASFRQQRLQGDYCFNFQLEHLPRKGERIRYNGTMWGTWNEAGALTRFKISEVAADAIDADSDAAIEVIVQNGPQPFVWKRSSGEESFEQLTGAELFEPLIPGIVYSPFDLQMPFIYWKNFDYEGPGRIGSRIVQRFLMLPAEDTVYASQAIEAVRVSLDDTYDALFRVEVLGPDRSLRSRFSVETFKKVQDQYIVKAITLKDSATKDRTRFQVKEASVGLQLNPSLLDPEAPLDPLMMPALEFKRL